MVRRKTLINLVCKIKHQTVSIVTNSYIPTALQLSSFCISELAFLRYWVACTIYQCLMFYVCQKCVLVVLYSQINRFRSTGSNAMCASQLSKSCSINLASKLSVLEHRISYGIILLILTGWMSHICDIHVQLLVMGTVVTNM